MSRLNSFLAIMLPGLFIGALMGIYPGYKTYEYTWKDASFCIQCHVHDYASVGWEKSVHGQKTTCHDCHHQPLHAYIKEAFLMATNPPKFPKDLHHTPHVPKNLCAACHLASATDQSTITGPLEKKDLQNIPKVDHSYLHKIHLNKETKFTLLNSHALTSQERSNSPNPLQALPTQLGQPRPMECADCHGGPTNRGHNFSAVEVSCVRCHASAHQTAKQTMPESHSCRSCHFQDFLAPTQNSKSH